MSEGRRLDEMPDVLTVAEVAAFLRLSPASVYEALRQQQIRAVRVGRRLLVPKASIARLLSGEESHR